MRNEIAIFVLFTALFVLCMNGRFSTSMDVEVYETVKRLVHTGSFGLEKETMASRVGRDGKHYCVEGLLVMLCAVPFYLISLIFGHPSGESIVLMNQFLTSLVCVLVYVLGRQFGFSKRCSLLLTAVYGLGTMAFVHSKYMFPEPLASIFFLLALFFLFKYRKERSAKLLPLTGIFAGATILIRPDSVLFLLGVGGAVLFLIIEDVRERRGPLSRHVKCLLLFALPLMFFFSVFALYNYLRFGSVFETGYALPLEKRLVKLSYPRQLLSVGDTIKGFLGMWIIPNRSIFLINPVLVLLLFALRDFWKKFRFELMVMGFLFLEFTYLYCNRGPLSFTGSAAWGVRYMIPMVSLMVLPIGLFLDTIFSQNRKGWKRVFVILLTVSFVIQLVGSSVNYQTVQMPAERHFGGSEARLKLTMDPSWSLLWRNIEILVRYGPQDFMFYNFIRRGDVPGWAGVSLLLLVITLLSSGYLFLTSLLPPAEAPARDGTTKGRERRGRKRT